MIEDCLESCKIITKEKALRLVITGGSSRIPAVRQAIKDFFPNATIDDKVHADEAVAIGAAHYTSFQIIAIPVTLSNIGIRKSDGSKIELIPRQTSIPTSMTKEFFIDLNELGGKYNI